MAPHSLHPRRQPQAIQPASCRECSGPESVMAVSQQPLQGRRQNSMFSQHTPLNHPCKQATKRGLGLSQGNLLLGLRPQSHEMTHWDHGSQVTLTKCQCLRDRSKRAGGCRPGYCSKTDSAFKTQTNKQNQNECAPKSHPHRAILKQRRGPRGRSAPMPVTDIFRRSLMLPREVDPFPVGNRRLIPQTN